jgi:glyoxylase-like metal-dependent hydrolase (beta-lactamase superfamily II)
MIEVTRHGDVTRLRMSSWRSRLVGYDVSAYLVRGVLVDTGCPAVGAELERVLDALRPEGALVTHAHEDHAGNVWRLARRGIAVGAGRETVEALRAVPPIGFYRRYTWGTMPPLRDTPLAPLSHDALRLVPAPGHSRDHHVVWDAGRGTLFGGDLFLGVRVRVAHGGEDPRGLVTSLRAAAALSPERLFDAHRGPVAHPAPLLAAKADWLEETIAAVGRRVADGWSDDAIRREVLGGEGLVGVLSRGDYSRLNFVRAVRRASVSRNG